LYEDIGNLPDVETPETDMHLILPDQFDRQPWKNGGGVTHEIAKAMDGADFLWRLSLAEVATDGPFSAFPGLTRCLTVIEGGGLYLDTLDGTLHANPLSPIVFSGDTPISSRLQTGPIRDLNLIFDARHAAGSVTPLSGPLTLLEIAAGSLLLGIFCVTGPLRVNGRDIPDFAFAHADNLNISLGEGAEALLIRISPIAP
jgi:environmental stress-induced protein Ves